MFTGVRRNSSVKTFCFYVFLVMCSDDFDFQEFWVGNEELVNLYEKRLGDAGYLSYKLGRTNNRGDGIYKHFCESSSFWFFDVCVCSFF